MKLIAFLVVCSLLVGCASTTSTDGPERTLSFVETNNSGEQVRTLRLRLTDKNAWACIAGGWKVARVLSDPKKYTSSPVYKLEKDQLEVLLVTGFCDSYNSYVGTLADTGFVGEHVMYGMGFSSTVGTVVGSPARK